MEKKVKVLLIDEEQERRQQLKESLEGNGYMVVENTPGFDAKHSIVTDRPDITLISWSGGGGQSSEICRYVRENGYKGCLIMLIPEVRDDVLIQAFNDGVNNCVPESYNVGVLVALINSKVRLKICSMGEEIYKVGSITHYPGVQVAYKNGQKIELTVLENRILLHFLRNLDTVITREELMMVAWGYQSHINTRTLDMHIVRLRKKLEYDPDRPLIIQTIRAIGYRFNAYRA